MKKTIITAAILTASVSIQAQFSTDYLKAADKYFKAADYSSAASYYEKYLAGGKTAGNAAYDPYKVTTARKNNKQGNDPQAVYKLAESYRLLTWYAKAEPLFKQMVEAGTPPTPLAYYQYATVLRAQAKYAEAEKAISTFLDTYKTEDNYTAAAKRELLNLRFIQQQLAKKDIGLYAVQKLAAGKEGASYAPAFAADNTVFFTATWADSASAKNKTFTNHVFQASLQGTTLGTPTQAGLATNNMHEGTTSLSADGNTVYLTRWTIGKEGKKAAIYKAVKANGQWGTPVLLNETVNAPDANTQQPALLNDGKYLLYASDRKDGLGGYDLWIAELDAEGQPVSTKNLGETINTTFNEEAPYYHAASGNLVFASNGRVGMGGYDLYYSKGQPGTWATPENFGYPVNSIKDDIYFTTRSQTNNILETVLLSSDRTAACCLELFYLNKTYKQYWTGKVVDCATQQPLSNASIAITDASGKKLTTLQTDASGSYAVEAPAGAVLTISGNKADYKAAVLTTTQNIQDDTISNALLCLAAVPKAPELFKEKKLETRNILFAYNEAVIPETDYAFLTQVADYLKNHPEARIEIGAHTDGKGSVNYNKALSTRRANACVKYLVEAGIDASRMAAKGYGKCCPIEKETTAKGKDIPEAREKNRRIEIKLL